MNVQTANQTVTRIFFLVLAAFAMAGVWGTTQTFAQDVATEETVETSRESRRAAKQEALASALGISVEELQATKEATESKEEFVEALGMTEEEYDAIKLEVRTERATARVNKALAAGEITQEEADERLAQIADGEFGRRGGNRGGNRGGHRGGNNNTIIDEVVTES